MHTRRDFFKLILAGSAAWPLLALTKPQPPATPQRILLQHSTVAGIQYHNAEALWPHLRPGDQLTLVREPYNHHDRYAVALHWRDQKIGYIPRRENVVIAQMLDRGKRLEANITRLSKNSDPWQRVECSIGLVV